MIQILPVTCSAAFNAVLHDRADAFLHLFIKALASGKPAAWHLCEQLQQRTWQLRLQCSGPRVFSLNERDCKLDTNVSNLGRCKGFVFRGISGGGRGGVLRCSCCFSVEESSRIITIDEGDDDVQRARLYEGSSTLSMLGKQLRTSR